MKEMVTYFHGGPEFQAASDAMQTLYLMNPSYVPYSDTHLSAANMLFLNPAGNALNPGNLPHAPSPSHHLVGLPLPTPTVAIGPPNSDGMLPSVHYNLWGSNMDHNSLGQHQQPIVSAGTSGGPHDVWSHPGVRRPVESPTRTRQGLSLSLSSQQAPYGKSSNVEPDIQGQRQSRHSPSSVSAVSSGVTRMQSVLFGSKYLRAAQELLDEVVNVGKGIKTGVVEGTKEKIKMNKESVVAVAGEGSNAGSEDGGNKCPAELTTAQKQELQMKKAKLVNMLDEVEQRYRQYHHQMQAVMSSFEQAAGVGSAKSYTSLALQTISKQVRCLKDAICTQIKATSKSLGEEDCLGAKVEGSRLRFADPQLRQQRALQQLGMIQHNAWRPQRGLPEKAVSVLRAWLFEHFLHPYPKDSDKHMLAKQTGLTRSQVSNWFINARVRLWKPMVEEMYLEEMKEHEKNGNEEGSSKNQRNESGSISAAMEESASLIMDQAKTKPKPEKPTHPNITCPTNFSNAPVSDSGVGGYFEPRTTAFNLIGAPDMEGVGQKSPKKPRSIDMQNSPSSILSMEMDMKFRGDERLLTNNAHHGGGFGPYRIEDQMGRFNPEQQLAPRFHGNGVSLTLGLPHFSGNQQNFLSDQNIQLGRRLELGTEESDFCGINTAPHSANGYQNIGMENRKRFVAQLLPDFVA